MSDAASRAWPRARGTEAGIPSIRARGRPRPLDRGAHRRRNRIERTFCRVKDWRRVAARYDRLAVSCFPALALVVVACFWTA